MLLQEWLVGSHTSGEQHGCVASHAAFSPVHGATQVQLVMLESHAWLGCDAFAQLFGAQHVVAPPAEQLAPTLAHGGASHAPVVALHV
jgi:hypothetical protein